MTHTNSIFGIVAEFDSPESLLHAAHQARENGYRKMDAHSPFPIEGLPQALNFPRTLIGPIVLAGGVLGALTAITMLCYSSIVHYPLNVGGRPYFSWPAFVPITFELTILFAGLAAVIGMLALNKLPMPYHPLFNVKRFELASRSAFFLCIQSNDPIFDLQRVTEFLKTLNPVEVNVVPQ